MTNGTEIEITDLVAIEVVKLIEEYLRAGGFGFNEDLLFAGMIALDNGSKIIITDTKKESTA